MNWLRRMLGLPRHKPVDLEKTKERSDAVLVKANAVLVEQRRIAVMRGSFQRADQRLGG